MIRKEFIEDIKDKMGDATITVLNDTWNTRCIAASSRRG